MIHNVFLSSHSLNIVMSSLNIVKSSQQSDLPCMPEGISLRKLRLIVVGGFAAQSPLMELLARLVHAATGLKFLQINPHHHLCQGMGKWVRDKGDKAARDLARNIARETVGPKLSSSVKFVVK